jgi:hypothetical protein
LIKPNCTDLGFRNNIFLRRKKREKEGEKTVSESPGPRRSTWKLQRTETDRVRVKREVKERKNKRKKK